MLGNVPKGVFGFILAAMLTRIYNFLYHPDSIVGVFQEFDTYVFDIFTDGRFAPIFAAVKIIGLGLLVVSFLIDLMDKVSGGDFSIQNYFVHWLRFFIMYIILNYSIDILRYFMDISTGVFNDLNGIITETMNTGADVDRQLLEYGINRYLGIVPKLGIFMLSVIPFAVSYLFTVVLYFFAVSRLFEVTVRISMAPIAAGVSFITPGLQSDFTKYVKRTAGLCFQIVVVMLISLGLTVTHNALIDSNSVNPTESGTEIGNPASCLEIDDDIREIQINGTWRKALAQNIVDNFYVEAYTEESITEFVDRMFDMDSIFISTGIMLAGLFMLFKSREISMRAFG